MGIDTAENLHDVVSRAVSRVKDAKKGAQDGYRLVAYDVNGIQDYVTANSRPVAMRGASLLIKEFDKVQEQRGAIFAGGGRGMFLLPREEATRLAEELPEQYSQRTITGTLAVAMVPWTVHDEKASLHWLKLRLQVEKDAARPPADELPRDKASQCVRCWMYQASPEMADGIERVCARCHAITCRGKEEARESGQGGRSLADVADRGYVAAVSADGNNMGRLFDGLETLESVATVSAAVRWLFRQAHETALRRAEASRYVDPITGGDDIRLFIGPKHLVRYLDALSREIQAEAQKFGSLEGTLAGLSADRVREIGIGVGVTIAGVKTSASWMLQRAHDLERRAKVKCLEATRSAVDFAWISSDEAYLGGASRERSAGPDRRPLSLDAEAWQPYIEQVRHLKKVPAAQRAIVAQRQTMGSEEFANLFRYQVARSDSWQTWYVNIGSDWRDPTRVVADMPDRSMVDLLRTLEVA